MNGVVAIKRNIIIDEHKLGVGGGGASSPIVERVFSCVGDEGRGEFTPNIDRCTVGVDFERGEDFDDISGGFGVGLLRSMRMFLVFKKRHPLRRR